MTSRKGVSNLQLSKQIGCTQKSAWFILHSLRHPCGGDVGKFRGIVEIDETYLGGKEGNKDKQRGWGRGDVGKQVVMGMRQRGGDTRSMEIDNTDLNTLHTLTQKNIDIGSTLYTDEARAYTHIGGLFYKHQSENHSAKRFVDGMSHK